MAPGKKSDMEQELAMQNLQKSLDDFKSAQFTVDFEINRKLDEMMRDLGRVVRGLYGDKDNDQLGLVQRQSRDEEQFNILDKRVAKLEKFNWKLGMIGVGGMLLIEILWNLFKTIFK